MSAGRFRRRRHGRIVVARLPDHLPRLTTITSGNGQPGTAGGFEPGTAPSARPFPRVCRNRRRCPAPAEAKPWCAGLGRAIAGQHGLDVGQLGLVFVGDDLGKCVQQGQGVDVAGGEGQGGRRHALELRDRAGGASPAQRRSQGSSMDGLSVSTVWTTIDSVVPGQGRPGIVDRGQVALEHGHESGVGRLARSWRGRQQPLDVPGVDEQPGQAHARAAGLRPP